MDLSIWAEPFSPLICPIVAATLFGFKCGCILMIVSGAVAISAVVPTYTVTPTVSVEFSPCSILGLCGAVVVVVVGVAIIRGVTGPIFTIVMTVELQLIHDPIEFGFHLAVVLINLDF